MATASKLLGTLTVLALLAAAGPSAADDDDRMAEAWTDALGDQEPVLTEPQFAKLNNLAFQAAVTKVCEGYALDGEKFAAALSEATSPAPDGMSAEDAEAWKTAVVMRFGTTYGLLLAEGNDDDDDFCASAKDLKEDGDVPNVWR